MSEFAVGTRVQVTDMHHRTGEIGYIEKIGLHHQNDLSYFVKFKDGKISSFFESCIITRPNTSHFNKTVKYYLNLGATSTAFYETEANAEGILNEFAGASAIKTVNHSDVTSKHFVSWFFKIADMADENPKKFPFEIITNSDNAHVYGYFNDNKLDAIIQVVEEGDEYWLYFFFVNGAFQNKGIGQILFQYVLNKYADKKLTLSVYTDNGPAIHIYQKYGFAIAGVGIGKGYRPDAPVYIMQRNEEMSSHGSFSKTPEPSVQYQVESLQNLSRSFNEKIKHFISSRFHLLEKLTQTTLDAMSNKDSRLPDNMVVFRNENDDDAMLIGILGDVNRACIIIRGIISGKESAHSMPHSKARSMLVTTSELHSLKMMIQRCHRFWDIENGKSNINDVDIKHRRELAGVLMRISNSLTKLFEKIETFKR